MLYGYPIEATAENWLHDCLYEIIQLIHVNLKIGHSIPDGPDIIPEKYRNRLRKHTGLQDRLKIYQIVVESLSPLEREQINQALIDQNEIACLLSCTCDCKNIDELPPPIREPVKELFGFAFKLLTKLEIRDNHYRKIYDLTPHICPFCGCEYFDAPTAPREALDHYLAESKYPFAAANLRNLVPMGHKCNSSYKLAQDILYNDDGLRRKSFDPYNHTSVRVSLDNSEPFAGSDGEVPQWRIEFEPTTEEITTWDQVFKIRERYQKNVLDPEFKNWLKWFYKWCKESNITPRSDQELIDAIDRFASYHEFLGVSDRAFLKAAVFRMLQKHCQQGNTRLISLIKDVVNGVVG